MSSAIECPWPRVVEVEPQGERCLRLRLTSGEQLLLDLTYLLERREAYWRLRHPRYFRQVAIDPLGGLCWPEGEDLAPDGLERYAIGPAPVEGSLGADPGADGDGGASN